MPAPATQVRAQDVGKTLGHVNLMADTFIANAKVEEQLTSYYAKPARFRVPEPGISVHNNCTVTDGTVASTSQLHEALSRARTLYGAGMGFASLGVLESVVRATIGLRWDDLSDMANLLALVDADISQAIQSSKEEIDAGRVGDLAAGRQIVAELRNAVKDSLDDCEAWGGEFPFERAIGSIEYWKI